MYPGMVVYTARKMRGVGTAGMSNCTKRDKYTGAASEHVRHEAQQHTPSNQRVTLYHHQLSFPSRQSRIIVKIKR